MSSFKEGVSRIRAAVVQIVVSAILPNKRNIDREIVGTGFIVSQEQYVATAAHVIGSVRSELVAQGATDVNFNARIPQKDLVGEFTARAGFMDVPLEIFELDERNDLALLRLAMKVGAQGLHITIQGQGKEHNITEVANATLHSGRVQVGEEVGVAGFPLQSAYLLVQRGVVSATPILPIPGTREEHEEIVVDIIINPGNSGGPAFLARNGRVVGVCRAQKLAPLVSPDQSKPTLYQHAGLSLITPVKFLLQLLEKRGIPVRVC